MKAIVLAAGYATRLRPLTDSIPKQLLPVGGRPMLDWIVDKLEEVDEIDAVHLVTNARFAPDFELWAAARGEGVTVHDDGTTSNEDRLGAIGDIRLTIERAGLAGDDLLVIAGDNLFDFSLDDYVAWWHRKGRASAVALYDCGSRELASQYGVVDVEADDRIVGFVEKPSDPQSTLVATATYIYHREQLPLVERYLAEGNPPDQPGNLIAWLHSREPVYGYRFSGAWFDIGDRDQLLEADNRLRARLGLPTRAEYALD
ncbi:MAG: glucose-phosphate thymidylyltransferase [Gaiellaceae bacterium]|nr:glucose-phosphate thymidylyltransferase [Gaiellaceae bacterium]